MDEDRQDGTEPLGTPESQVLAGWLLMWRSVEPGLAGWSTPSCSYPGTGFRLSHGFFNPRTWSALKANNTNPLLVDTAVMLEAVYLNHCLGDCLKDLKDGGAV